MDIDYFVTFACYDDWDDLVWDRNNFNYKAQVSRWKYINPPKELLNRGDSI